MNKKIEKELNKGNGIFITRAIIFALLLISPAVYIFVKYECRNFTSKVALSGWAILGLLLLVVGVFIFFKYLVFGGKWSYWKQVVKGVIKVLIPFALVVGLIMLSINYLKELLYVVIFSGVCYFSAYLVNPFPEWTYKKTLGETQDVMELAFRKVQSSKRY